MGIEEDTPGIGFWISVGLGLVTGGIALAWGAGWIVAALVALAVAVTGIVLLS